MSNNSLLTAQCHGLDALTVEAARIGVLKNGLRTIGSRIVGARRFEPRGCRPHQGPCGIRCAGRDHGLPRRAARNSEAISDDRQLDKGWEGLEGGLRNNPACVARACVRGLGLGSPDASHASGPTHIRAGFAREECFAHFDPRQGRWLLWPSAEH